MAHSATRITPAPRPPALAALHAAPSPLVEPTDTMNRAVRSLNPPPRSPARQSAPRGGCAPPTTVIAGSTGLVMSERDGLCREATTDSACSTTSTASPEGRYPDTRVPGRWVSRTGHGEGGSGSGGPSRPSVMPAADPRMRKSPDTADTNMWLLPSGVVYLPARFTGRKSAFFVRPNPLIRSISCLPELLPSSEKLEQGLSIFESYG